MLDELEGDKPVVQLTVRQQPARILSFSRRNFVPQNSVCVRRSCLFETAKGIFEGKGTLFPRCLSPELDLGRRNK